MTPDERNLLGRFLQDLAQARGGAKDADAAQMIDQAVRTNPDAGYLLVQHALLADQALHAAQDRIAELERAGPSRPTAGGSFLGGAWGGSAQPAAQPQGYGAQGYGAAQPAPVQAGGLGGLFGGGGAPARTGAFGSFLRQAGTTAAGVAGGEMLFSGLSDLFGGHRGGGFGYGGGPETVIVNDYGGGGGYGPDGGQGGFDGGYGDGGYDDGGYDDGGVG